MDTLQQNALLRLARDLSRGDAKLIRAMKAAIANPPTTTEDVGFYVSGNENAFENCFRKLCGLLEDREHVIGVEDKYCFDIFEQWVEAEQLDHLPASLFKAIPLDDTFGDPSPENRAAKLREYFPMAARDLDEAFAARGTPLLSLDTAGGDTLLFVTPDPDAAERWRDVELGQTHDGHVLGVRSPMWHKFWKYIAYSSGIKLGRPPADLPEDPPLRQLSELAFLRET